MKPFQAKCVSWLLGFLILVLGGIRGFAADHAEAPLVMGNPQQDINDIYAFQSPDNSRNVVFVLTVNPEAGLSSPVTLDPNTVYEFLIDTDDDDRSEINFALRASRPNGLNQQNVILQTGRTTLARGRTEQDIRVRGGGTLFVGVLDDPFFFDAQVLSAPDGMNDFGPNENVTAIVLEMPRRNLRTDSIGVWAITEVRGRQFDRMGRPGINSLLITSKDDFNQGEPVDDVADFRTEVINNIDGLNMAIGNMNPPDAGALADMLLPDILTIDTSDDSGFLNGRRLEDDVIDAELNLLTNGAVTTDNVANDSTFRDEFPYLDEANPLP